MKTEHTRPPIESLACVESDCDLYGQPGQGNLTVRKVYGEDEIRYLRCTRCRSEFSERKGAQGAPRSLEHEGARSQGRVSSRTPK